MKHSTQRNVKQETELPVMHIILTEDCEIRDRDEAYYTHRGKVK
jgi:hypothetical protein